jgi:predicted transcriptional regulator
MRNISIISIGKEAFQILNLISKKKDLSEIIRLTNRIKQSINGDIKFLLSYGWIEKKDWGKYKVTKSGKYFLKTIYMNSKIRERLK